MQQLQDYANYYKERAGIKIAKQFVIAAKNALQFISESPNACVKYEVGEENHDLHKHHFRKWNLQGFPHLILFRIDNSTIFIDVIYTHKMDIESRLKNQN